MIKSDPRRTADYQAIFMPGAGRAVLDDLIRSVDMFCYDPNLTERQAGFAEGRKSVIAEILNIVYPRNGLPSDPGPTSFMVSHFSGLSKT